MIYKLAMMNNNITENNISRLSNKDFCLFLEIRTLVQGFLTSTHILTSPFLRYNKNRISSLYVYSNFMTCQDQEFIESK